MSLLFIYLFDSFSYQSAESIDSPLIVRVANMSQQPVRLA